MSEADDDIEYLYNRASNANMSVSEIDEEIYLELVGKQISDGKGVLEARSTAFMNWSGGKIDGKTKTV